MSKEAGFEQLIAREDIPKFLRELADALEQDGESETGMEILVRDFRKLKVEIKEEYGQHFAKLKVKRHKRPYPTGIVLPPHVPDIDEVRADDDGESREDIPERPSTLPSGLPKYKYLKKRMRSSFKVIFSMLHEEKMPPEEAVSTFLADSALMVQYPGRGDEYYDAYSQACKKLAEAFAAQDMTAMHAACDELEHLKRECHKRYD